jgi:hypothetical protein
MEADVIIERISQKDQWHTKGMPIRNGIQIDADEKQPTTASGSIQNGIGHD